MAVSVNLEALRDRSLNTERGHGGESGGGGGGGPEYFFNDMGGLETHILLIGGVSNILPAKGHMSHDLGAVTIFRFLELELGLGLGLDLG